LPLDRRLRRRSCFDRVNTFFGRLVGRYFVQEAFSGDSKDIAQDLVDRIKVSFGENLPNIDWMDSETKLQAQRKLDLMRTKIGYPETWPDYEGFTVYRSMSLLLVLLQRYYCSRHSRTDIAFVPTQTRTLRT